MLGFRIAFYSLMDDASGRFQIDSGTGVVTVANASLFNFEGATSHTIEVRASDGTANSTDTTFTISVLNVYTGTRRRESRSVCWKGTPPRWPRPRGPATASCSLPAQPT